MNRKKVCIITLYHNNYNYGGVAQAYALSKFFNNNNCECEVIDYKKTKYLSVDLTKNNIIKSNISIKQKITNKMFNILDNLFSNYKKKELNQRAIKLDDFRNSIPHTKLYDDSNIGKIKNLYDVYVTGSDQCWNPGTVNGSYVFDFLTKKDNKTIISYASSIATDILSEEYIDYMKKELLKYNAISLREKNTCEILSKSTGLKVENVLDPTLIIDKKEWDNLSSERIIDGEYIFCYTLGNDLNERKIIKKIAKSMKLKLVTVPYIKNGSSFKFKIIDYHFGNEQMIDISFPDFLSLIKNSSFVLTDSFHAICFAYIFKKDFYVIGKKEAVSTKSRIINLLDYFGLEERLISKANEAKKDKIDYNLVEKRIKPLIEKSRNYILRNIK